MDDVDKVWIQIAIDRGLAEDAQFAGFDLAEVTEAALRRKLAASAESNRPLREDRINRWRRKHAEAIAHQNEIIDREGHFGEEWRTF
jgi:post-segregation antitoxin (ccd killing protein)